MVNELHNFNQGRPPRRPGVRLPGPRRGHIRGRRRSPRGGQPRQRGEPGQPLAHGRHQAVHPRAGKGRLRQVPQVRGQAAQRGRGGHLFRGGGEREAGCVFGSLAELGIWGLRFGGVVLNVTSRPPYQY